MVPGDLRYTKDHEWVRVDGDEAVVGITQYAADQLGDIVFVELPDVGPDPRASTRRSASSSRSRRSATCSRRSGGEVTATNDALAGTPELVNSDPYGDGWMLRVKLADPAAGGRAPRRRGVRAAHRRGLTDAVRPAHGRRPGPDARGDRHRLGRRAVRRHPGGAAGRAAARSPEPEPELLLAARLQALAGRNRIDLASFLGAGAYRHWTPARRRPDAAPRRVVHGLHAVPARGQPGHAPEHLRVPVAARGADRRSTWCPRRTTTAAPRPPRPR